MWTYAIESGRVPGPGERFITTEFATPKFCGGDLMVPEYRKQLRRPNEAVVVKTWISGHGGDYVWCENRDGSVAPYGLHELRYPDPVGEDFVI